MQSDSRPSKHSQGRLTDPAPHSAHDEPAQPLKHYHFETPSAGAFASWRVLCLSWSAVAIAPPKTRTKAHSLAMPITAGICDRRNGSNVARQRKRAAPECRPGPARMHFPTAVLAGRLGPRCLCAVTRGTQDAEWVVQSGKEMMDCRRFFRRAPLPCHPRGITARCGRL